MIEEDVHKKAFAMDNGYNEFSYIPFGLKIIPATFQCEFFNVLRDNTSEKCLAYLKDISVSSTTLRQH